jgi:hypothetical protein
MGDGFVNYRELDPKSFGEYGLDWITTISSETTTLAFKVTLDDFRETLLNAHVGIVDSASLASGRGEDVQSVGNIIRIGGTGYNYEIQNNVDLKKIFIGDAIVRAGYIGIVEKVDPVSGIVTLDKSLPWDLASDFKILVAPLKANYGTESTGLTVNSLGTQVYDDLYVTDGKDLVLYSTEPGTFQRMSFQDKDLGRQPILEVASDKVYFSCFNNLSTAPDHIIKAYKNHSSFPDSMELKAPGGPMVIYPADHIQFAMYVPADSASPVTFSQQPVWSPPPEADGTQHPPVPLALEKNGKLSTGILPRGNPSNVMIEEWPAIKVVGGEIQVFPTSDPNQIITFTNSTVEYDLCSEWSGDTYTASMHGVYNVCFAYTIVSGDDSGLFDLTFLVNGSPSDVFALKGGYMHTSTQLYLYQYDTLQVKLSNFTGADVSFNSAKFSVTKIV